MTATPAPSRRGRPRRKPEDQDARKALIQAGLAQLTERGYASVALDEITAAAGVTKGSFYHYFPTKAAFGATLIDAYGAYFEDKLRRAFDRTDLSPFTRLTAFTEEAEAGMARFDFRRGCLIGNLGQEMGSLPEAFRTRLIAVFERWQSLTATCLRDAQAAGEIGPDHDPDALAELFWTGWEGAVLRTKLQRNPEPLRRFTDGFLRLARS
ncbi:acrylate utilization transcriptional regulator AcuR [Thioclava electrotropha]|uniref:TetR family transcriptional regulator n=1 Tax=Thioclava electrotropha TaxID=1549850 RepID=A0ABX6YWD9_9RHOB|nr:TetR/AcrR family transcriptional regulator [Thioclava electrotropha]QPZ92181.1 TetR family transcriptional regulator [Thioclava electrotropha]